MSDVLLTPSPLALDVAVRPHESTEECIRCGMPSIKGHLYCSDICRWLARKCGESGSIELDGIEAHPLDHAKRYGVARSTFWYRLSNGWGLLDAIRTPPGGQGR